MAAAPFPDDESARLAALHALEVLDSKPEAEFDALVRAASLVCGSPISLISLIDGDRQWFKANLGLPDVSETPRDTAFCAHAILGKALLEVPDATQDLRFADNPMVLGAPEIRFYAGAPVLLSDGSCVGTLCVIDRQPRSLSDVQREILVHLASVAARALEGRRAELALIGERQRLEQLAVEARRLAAELAEQHELLRVTLQSIADAVITTDAQGQVVWLNPAAERMTGWLRAEAAGLPLTQIFQVIDEATRGPGENPVALCLAQGNVVGMSTHAVLISHHGEEFGIEDSAAPIRNEQGELLGAVLVFRDVTEQRRLSGEMSYRATHDALTGLVNRAEFETRLRRVLQKAHEDHNEHALLYIDLDQFKLVNDACGHAVGDQLLQQVSKLLADTVRSRDTLARLGGDEFAVILEHCNATQAQGVAQQICDRMNDFRFIHDEQRFRIGTSIGLVPVDRRWTATAAILQAADTSCYAAKESGRNRVHAWFDSDLAMRARHQEMQWTTRIEQALDEDRFVLFAQRIEALGKDSKSLHAEALLRMVDVDGAIIPPGAFLPAAERFHLSSRIDRWVLKKAISWIRGLPAAVDLENLSINLSVHSIGDRAFHRWAIDMLAEAGFETCKRLCLEITETVAVTNLADAAAFIEKIRGLGVRVALDDFGAGASSFGYLKTLPVDFLKIDGQFIKNLVDDRLDEAAVRCFADVARLMGVQTVAEFVDRREVLDRLRQLGVDFAQGFFVHRPESLDELVARLVSTPLATPL